MGESEELGQLPVSSIQNVFSLAEIDFLLPKIYFLFKAPNFTHFHPSVELNCNLSAQFALGILICNHTRENYFSNIFTASMCEQNVPWWLLLWECSALNEETRDAASVLRWNQKRCSSAASQRQRSAVNNSPALHSLFFPASAEFLCSTVKRRWLDVTFHT